MSQDRVDVLITQARELLNALQAEKGADRTERARHLAVACTLLEGVIGYLETWVRVR